MAMSGSAETSCAIRSTGKIAARSSGPTGSPVAGLRGGGGGSPGRSASRFTQLVGISSSERGKLTCSPIGRDSMPSPLPNSAHLGVAVTPDTRSNADPDLPATPRRARRPPGGRGVLNSRGGQADLSRQEGDRGAREREQQVRRPASGARQPGGDRGRGR